MTIGIHQQISRPRPPAKGSFPLDHLGECQEAEREYLRCLSERRGAREFEESQDAADERHTAQGERERARSSDREERGKDFFPRRPPDRQPVEDRFALPVHADRSLEKRRADEETEEREDKQKKEAKREEAFPPLRRRRKEEEEEGVAEGKEEGEVSGGGFLEKAREGTSTKKRRRRRWDHLPCRHLAQVYLQCRMEKNLMAQEDMASLGFKRKQLSDHAIHQASPSVSSSPPDHDNLEKTQFASSSSCSLPRPSGEDGGEAAKQLQKRTMQQSSRSFFLFPSFFPSFCPPSPSSSSVHTPCCPTDSSSLSSLSGRPAVGLSFWRGLMDKRETALSVGSSRLERRRQEGEEEKEEVTRHTSLRKPHSHSQQKEEEEEEFFYYARNATPVPSGHFESKKRSEAEVAEEEKKKRKEEASRESSSLHFLSPPPPSRPTMPSSSSSSAPFSSSSDEWKEFRRGKEEEEEPGGLLGFNDVRKQREKGEEGRKKKKVQEEEEETEEERKKKERVLRKEDLGFVAGCAALQPYTQRGFFGRICARYGWTDYWLKNFPLLDNVKSSFFSLSASSSSPPKP